MSKVVLTLPDNLAREAAANGLLKPEPIEAMLRAEIRRRRVNNLFTAADHLAALDQTLTAAEVEPEIAVDPRERHSFDAGRR
jgi:hypothetical protein